MNESQPTQQLSGIWKRFLALLIDSICLTMICFILGFFLENQFIALGGWGRLIGLLLATLYFGFFNSRIFNGQTIGKILLKIKVIDVHNNSISLPRSLVRALIFWTPFMLNGAIFSTKALNSGFLFLFSIIIFGGIFSIAYLAIFNRKTRQSFHDIVVGTYVVNLESEIKPFEKVWRFHFYTTAFIFIFFLLTPFAATKLLNLTAYEGLKTTHDSLEDRPDVISAGFGISYTSQYSPNHELTKTASSYADIYLNENKIQDEAFVDELAKQIVEIYPIVKQHDYLLIKLHYGYDIGFWSSWQTSNKRFNLKKENSQ